MSKFWVIFKREYAQVVRKKSFIIGLLLTPLLMTGFMIVPAMLAGVQSSTSEHLAIIDQSGESFGIQFKEAIAQYILPDSEIPSYQVDTIHTISIQNEQLFNATDSTLRQAVNDGDLRFFLVIKPGAQYSDTNLYLVTNSTDFRAINRFERQLSRILSTSRLEMSEVNLDIDSVLALTERVDLTIQDAKGESIPFEIKYFSALIFVMIMFGMILGYGQMVMRSVIEEKNSRVMEVMISSVSPFELMTGKIFGLGAATFTQVAIWYVIGIATYFMRGAINISPSIERIVFDPFIMISFLAFMVTGYLLFSTIFALLGSIVNSEKEAQSFVMPITLCMMLPVIMGIYLVQHPNSTVSIGMSLIPIFTPTMMMMRIIFVAPTLTEYSFTSGIVLEAIIGFVILSLTVLFIIWLTSRIFRIGILMYGKRPTLPEIIKWVKR